MWFSSQGSPWWGSVSVHYQSEPWNRSRAYIHIFTKTVLIRSYALENSTDLQTALFRTITQATCHLLQFINDIPNFTLFAAPHTRTDGLSLGLAEFSVCCSIEGPAVKTAGARNAKSKLSAVVPVLNYVFYLLPKVETLPYFQFQWHLPRAQKVKMSSQ